MSLHLPRLVGVASKPGDGISSLLRIHESGIRLLQDGKLADLLDATLEAAMRVVDADAGCVQLIDPETGGLIVAAHRGFGRARVPIDLWASPAASHAQATEACRPRAVADVRVAGACPDDERRRLLETSMLSFQTAPLLDTNQAAFGVVTTLARRPQETRNEQRRELGLLTAQAADFIGQSRTRRALEHAHAQEQRRRTAAEDVGGRQERFIATLSHELRQPLAALLAAVQVEQRSPHAERRARATDVVAAQLCQLTRLVDDLADLSRIARGILELRRERVDLRTIARDAVDMAAAALAAKAHETIVDVGAAPAWVRADAARLKQVVSNLLQNAASYTPAGGQVRVTVVGCPDHVRLSVRDNGIGIPTGELRRIFDAFERGDGHGNENGFGIGLAVVRQMVELHGGSVEARSDSGPGTEFVVTLPAA